MEKETKSETEQIEKERKEIDRELKELLVQMKITVSSYDMKYYDAKTLESLR